MKENYFARERNQEKIKQPWKIYCGNYEHILSQQRFL